MAAPDIVDQWLPGVAKTSRKDEVVPQVDEQRAVDDRFDVGRATLTEGYFVGLGALSAVGQIDCPIRTGPFQVQRELEAAEGVPCRPIGQTIRYRCDATAPEVDLLPGEDRCSCQPEAGRVENALEGVDRRRYPPVLVCGERWTRRPGPSRELGLGEPSPLTGLEDDQSCDVVRLYQIRYREIGPIRLMEVGAAFYCVTWFALYGLHHGWLWICNSCG